MKKGGRHKRQPRCARGFGRRFPYWACRSQAQACLPDEMLPGGGEKTRNFLGSVPHGFPKGLSLNKETRQEELQKARSWVSSCRWRRVRSYRKREIVLITKMAVPFTLPEIICLPPCNGLNIGRKDPKRPNLSLARFSLSLWNHLFIVLWRFHRLRFEFHLTSNCNEPTMRWLLATKGYAKRKGAQMALTGLLGCACIFSLDHSRAPDGESHRCHVISTGGRNLVF